MAWTKAKTPTRQIHARIVHNRTRHDGRCRGKTKGWMRHASFHPCRTNGRNVWDTIEHKRRWKRPAHALSLKTRMETFVRSTFLSPSQYIQWDVRMTHQWREIEPSRHDSKAMIQTIHTLHPNSLAFRTMWVETPQLNILATSRHFRRLVFRSVIFFSSHDEIPAPNVRQGCTMHSDTLVVSFLSCIDDGLSCSFPSYAHLSPSTYPFFHVHVVFPPFTSFVSLHLPDVHTFPIVFRSIHLSEGFGVPISPPSGSDGPGIWTPLPSPSRFLRRRETERG